MSGFRNYIVFYWILFENAVLLQFVLIIMSFKIENLSVDFVKLTDGHHEFDYDLDKTFFEHFGNHDILDANLLIELDIEKHGDLIVADLFTSGTMNITCDRCLTEIGLPIEAEFKIIYHLNSEHTLENEVVNDLNSDVIYLKPQDYSFNITQAVYESTLIALPMVKNCDDLIDKPCDQLMLDKIDGINQGSTQLDPRWEKLKNILNNEE